MESSRGRGRGGGEAGEEKASANAVDAAGGKPDLDLDDGFSRRPTTPAALPPPPCYTVACTPYTGEPAARGLVANRMVRRGEVIETAHCVVLKDYPGSENNVSTSASAAAGRSSSSAMAPAMGLEHYVFFDSRGRSSCSPPSGGERRSGEGASSPPPPALRVLLALGVGSLFNHSRRPNVDWRAGTSRASAAPLVQRRGARSRRSWPASQGEEEKERPVSSAAAPPSPPSALWPIISFIAARDIDPGEELTISYGEPWWSESESESEEEEGSEEEGAGGAAVDDDYGSGGGRNNEAEEKKPREHRLRRERPTHSHMDDEDAFLGAMTLGGD